MSPWRSITTHYDGVSHTAKRRVTCGVCGKKFNRQRTFTNTVNQWNLSADGAPKSWAEVEADVMELVRRWEPEADCGKHGATS